MKVFIANGTNTSVLDVHRTTFVPIPNGDMDKVIERIAVVGFGNPATVYFGTNQELTISKRNVR